MGTGAESTIDKWLAEGGVVLAASDRAARALQRAYHRRRRTAGLMAWPAPAIHSWASFTRTAWEDRADDGRMLLTPLQERSVWAEIIGREAHLAAVLAGPRDRLASLAMQAHELLASYLPRYLYPAARATWDRDPGAFSAWLSAFDRICEQQGLLGLNVSVLNLSDLLKADCSQRPAILVAGFDRLLPVQREVLDAWGTWQQLPAGPIASELHYYAAGDGAAELAACAAWCRRHLALNPESRLLVIAQQIPVRRGEIERAFLQLSEPGDAPLFEFSLGIPLSNVPFVHAAHLVLRWLDGTLPEHELDWLLSTGFTSVDRTESLALQNHMRALRRRGLARPQWSLEAFAAQSPSFEGALGSWYRRVTYARRKLMHLQKRKLSPFEWARETPALLESLGIPGERRLASAEFQAWRRWEQTLENCGSLGFDGRRVNWIDFLGTLARTLDKTLFAPESNDAPIQIVGPTESAGLTANAIWFLGVSEEEWPATSAAHPFLPLHVQREAGMPHATKRSDWDLAQTVTARLAASAQEVSFSYARQGAQADARPSRIVAHFAGAAQALPAHLSPSALPACSAVPFNDVSRVPFSIDVLQGAQLPGGAAVLTAQSQCPFKAFATTRLGARGWNPAEYALSPSQRGQLLHATLHTIWGGPPTGLRSLSDLKGIADKKAFVTQHVEKALREELPSTVLERMPKRYLDLESARLVSVVCNWLEYEESRVPFTVAETEARHEVDIEGLPLGLRLDRIDRLCDNSLAVIDYKTGSTVARQAWDLPRPADVQLPLYSSFALDGEEPGGLLFARMRARDARFIGHVRNARATLFTGLRPTDPLVRQPLSSDQLQDWQETIEQLARDFIRGDARVDPRDFPGTCEHCDLHAVCRIYENQTAPLLEEDAEADSDE
ncbi:MAG: PD-(D/E)XK nuclease family protein, partial [Terracidiphilus sp.]